jgi:hypothetical protein
VPRRFVGCTCGCLGALALAVIAVGAWSMFAASLGTPLLGNLRYQCTLGVADTNATVTIEGPLAGHECRHLLNQTYSVPVQVVEVSGTGTEPVICSFEQDYTTITIRASASLKIASTQVCDLVRQKLTLERLLPSRLARQPANLTGTKTT